MISFLSFGKKKESKKDVDVHDDDIFPELMELRNRVDKGVDNRGDSLPFEEFNPFRQLEGSNLPTFQKQENESHMKTMQHTPLSLPTMRSLNEQPIQQLSPPPQPIQQQLETSHTIPTPEPTLSTERRENIAEFKEASMKEEEKPELYIKVDDYKEVLSILKTIRAKLTEIDSLISEIRDIKSKEIERLNISKKELEESKSNVDRVLELLKGF